MSPIPSRVPYHLSTVRPDGRTDIPWGLSTLQRHSRASPFTKRVVQLPPQLRSQVFSTSQRFSQTRVPRPCFMPQPFVGLSLQSLPLAEIAIPLETDLLPCSYRPDAPANLGRDLIAPGFPDSRAFGAVAWFPRRLWAFFPRTEARFPITLGHRRQSAFSPSFTCFEALNPPASPFAPTRVTPRRRPILSWASSPAEIPQRSRSFKPAQHPEGNPARALTRRLRHATPGTAAPGTG